ncbi:MAG: hypothetical protein V4722_18690 [Bacteroidota bacterium]
MKYITSRWVYYKCLIVAVIITILLFYRIIDFKFTVLDFFLLFVYTGMLFLFARLNLAKYSKDNVLIYNLFRKNSIAFCDVIKLQPVTGNGSVDILNVPYFIEFKTRNKIKRRYFLVAKSGLFQNWQDFKKIVHDSIV